MKNMFLLLAITFIISGCAATSQPKCNIHVINLMQKKNIYLPDTSANGLDNYLRNSKDWTRLPRKDGRLDHKTAYAAAKSGKTVLAAYNSGAQKSGHIVEIYGSRPMRWSKSFNAYVPYSSGSVNGKKARVTPLSDQFGADKEPKMNYYVYKK